MRPVAGLYFYEMAETLGFAPRRGKMPRRFSKPLHSASLARLHIKPPIVATRAGFEPAAARLFYGGGYSTRLSYLAGLCDSAAIFALTSRHQYLREFNKSGMRHSAPCNRLSYPFTPSRAREAKAPVDTTRQERYYAFYNKFFAICQHKKTARRGKDENPASDLLQRRLRSLRGMNGTMRERDDALSNHCGFWTVEQYHKTAIRSRPKSSGGAHASMRAPPLFFYLLSAVVSADDAPKRRRRLLRRLFCGKRRLRRSPRIHL